MNDAENISLNTFLAKVERVVDAPPSSVRHIPLRPILSAAMLVDALCGPLGFGRHCIDRESVFLS